MSKTAKTTGVVTIEPGRDPLLRIRSGPVYLSMLRGLVGEVLITVTKLTRSTAQNSLLWLWNGIIAQDTGNSADAIHEHSKRELLPGTKMTFADKLTGELIETEATPTTHNLSKDAFTKYLDNYRQYWTDQGYDLPLPEELKNKIYKNEDK